MKKYVFSFFLVLLIFCGTVTTLSFRGFDNGRWTNRDKQEEKSGIEGFFTESSVYTKRIGEDSDAAGGDPLETEAFGKARQTFFYHMWEAKCMLRNKNKRVHGRWSGYADVPNKEPDTDEDFNYRGKVKKNFKRSDQDWWLIDGNTIESVNSCVARAEIDGYDPCKKIAYDSVSHVPF